MHRIIVVGGGAGGLELATRLGDRYASKKRGASDGVKITLVDRNPTHVWKPLLHEVAAGSMDPFTQELSYAAQARWHNFEFQLGELIGVNRESRRITLGAIADEDSVELLPRRELEYDTLVVAIGSTTHFFGVKGAQEHSIALDTVGQAERFRKRLISACVRAEFQSSECPTKTNGEPKVQVAIVGAGATGVELSAELRNTAQVLSAYGLHKLDPRHDIGIVLIEAGPRILPALSERVSQTTTELLTKLGVKVMTGEVVAEIAPGCLHTSSGNTIWADLTVWAAGIKAPPVLSMLDGLLVNRLGQLEVRPTLQTTLDDNVFALGDCAACPWPAHEGKNVPPRAQAAHQQASFLFRSLRARIGGRTLPEFSYRDLGSLVSLGHHSAVGNLMGGVIGGNMFIEGLLARFMYMSLHRMHVAALHGISRMALDTVAHWLRRMTAPRVKLH